MPYILHLVPGEGKPDPTEIHGGTKGLSTMCRCLLTHSNFEIPVQFQCATVRPLFCSKKMQTIRTAALWNEDFANF